jgi:hypothetical protein
MKRTKLSRIANSGYSETGSRQRKSFVAGIALAGCVVPVFAAMGCSDQADETTTVESHVVNGYPSCGTFPDNAVCACSTHDLLGNCTIFSNDVRFYMNLNTSPYTYWNDKIVSVVVGPAAKVKLCLDAGMIGPCGTWAGTPGGFEISDLGGWDNQISSIRVDNLSDDCNNLQPDQVAIFDDINFNQGTGGDCAVLRPGASSGQSLQYPFPAGNPPSGANPTFSGGGFGLRNDAISAVKTGSNATITLFHDSYFLGSGLRFGHNSSAADLRVFNFNDQTSSIQVTSP